MAERIGPRKTATAKVAGGDDRKKTPWVALGIAGVILVGVLAFLFNDPNKAEREFGKMLESAEARKVPTARGQRAGTKLPDSSTVRLAPETMLIIPPKGTRGAGVEGAAHFVVRADTSGPFRVRVRKVGVESQSGALAVTSYPEDKEVFIKAIEGGLVVHPSVEEKATVDLAVGPGMAVNEAGVTRMLTQPESDAAFAWVDGNYALTAVPLGNTIPILQRWYNTPVALADNSLASRPVTAMLKLDSSKDALDLISTAAGVHITFKGDTLTLADGAPPAPAAAKKKGK